MKLLEELYGAVLEGEDDLAEELTRTGIAAGIGPQQLIDDAMIPAMAEAGRRFEVDEYFVPELLLAGRAIKAGLEILRPLLTAGDLHHAGSVLIGTVQGDIHDIGKNLVAVMLEGVGFEVVDLGTDVAPDEFVEAIEAAGLRDKVRVLVGGAPITEERATEFGADAYAGNANSAVRAALRLVASQ